jgi:uncharacterized membrane protein
MSFIKYIADENHYKEVLSLVGKAALGIVLITLIGIFVFKQVPDIPAYIGLALIMAGVIVINLFSKMEVH